MDAAIVSSTVSFKSVARTLCDKEISVAWCLSSWCSTVVLGDCHYADSQWGSTVFIAIYIVVVHAIFQMLESRNVRRSFLVHLTRSVRDVLGKRVVVPTETGIATTVQSRGLLTNG